MNGRGRGPGGSLPFDPFFLEELRRPKRDFMEKYAQREMRMMNQTSIVAVGLELP
jgi:hypothetical protein